MGEKETGRGKEIEQKGRRVKRGRRRKGEEKEGERETFSKY